LLKAQIDAGRRIAHNFGIRPPGRPHSFFRVTSMTDDNYVMLEVAIDRALYERLIEAAQRRGESVSEFTEKALRAAADRSLSEPPAKIDAEGGEEE
jgi:hypothetical protein